MLTPNARGFFYDDSEETALPPLVADITDFLSSPQLEYAVDSDSYPIINLLTPSPAQGSNDAALSMTASTFFSGFHADEFCLEDYTPTGLLLLSPITDIQSSMESFVCVCDENRLCACQLKLDQEASAPSPAGSVLINNNCLGAGVLACESRLSVDECAPQSDYEWPELPEGVDSLMDAIEAKYFSC